MPETARLSDVKRRLLAKYLSGEIDVKRGTSTIPRRTLGEPIPLSFAQEQVWLHAQMAPDVPLYNEPVTIHYSGHLDVAALERSFNEILRRHEAWRTSFVTVDGTPVQKIEPSITISLPVIDLRGLSEEHREAKALRIATADARIPLDLSQAPLFRVKLIRLKDEEHRMYLTLSHIIFDGVAIYRGFLPELSTLYNAFTLNEPSPLPEPPIQHGDFCIWQRQSNSAEKLAKHMEYWRGQLGGASSALELPTDRPRPAIQTFRGSMHPFVLNSSLTEAIRRVSHLEGTSPFQLLLAGFAALLQRYSGDDRITIGSVTAGRDCPETELLLGYFLNTVPLRADLSDDPTFAELAKRMRNLIFETLKHDCVPFGDLIQEFSPNRDLSRNPLFDVMFSLEPPMPEVDSAWRLTQMDVDSGATKYDLYLELDERHEEVLARFHYSTDLFDLRTIRRMAGHWVTLLEAATTNPGLHISELPVLTDTERGQHAEWNNTTVDYPRDLRIHDLFELQSQRSPEAVALLFDNQQVTYRELNERSNQLAHYLHKLGVASGSPVGLCVERSPEIVVALLGILKAGGAYVPLDPGYPNERLAFMLLDSGAKVLLTQTNLTGKLLPQSWIQPVLIDSDWEKIACETAEAPSGPGTAEDAAYVMYTSGSTGLPKGVLGTHRATVNRLTWMWREYPFQAGDICSQKTSLSFVDSVWEIFGPLLAGIPNLIIPDETVKDVDRLVDVLASKQVTRIVLVPSLLRALLSSNDFRGKLRELKLWISSGETLTRDLAESFAENMPGHTLVNLYGSTEVAADATYYQVGQSNQPSSIPIGRPIANTQVYVLDARQQQVPLNVQGELYIGGDAVSLGYWNRPDITSERFVPDRFSNKPGARLYRTGDLGRYLADGNIEYLGRRDYQVKIRGVRVELGEVEAILRSHAAVNQCVVIAREDESGDKRLVAYFEPVQGLQFTIAEIRAHLKKQLPEHMIPAAIVPMDSLPLNLNGKIDRRALPNTEEISREHRTALAAPRDEFEQMLVRLWSKVLKVSSVGVYDNFFELGGHSLLAVRIVVEIEKLFKKRLPLATFVQAPTIAALADILRKEHWIPSWASLVPMKAGGSRPPLFLMHAHGGNVLEYQSLANHLEPDQPLYALQARGLDGCIANGRTIEEMAAVYLAEIRSLQPEGPYFLGGFCFGGLLAWEAAQQLSAAGQKIALLVLIQTMNPAYARFKPGIGILRQWWHRTVKRIDLERDNLSNRGVRYFGDRCKDVADIVQAKAAIAYDKKINGGRSRNGHVPMPYILESLRQAHAKAYMSYTLRPYRGEVLLLRATKQLAGLMIDETSGWKHVVDGRLEICHVPGHQQTMLGEPNVASLATALTAALKSARQSRAGVELSPAFAPEEATHLVEAR